MSDNRRTQIGNPLAACATSLVLCHSASAQTLLAHLHFRSVQPAVGVSPPLPYGSNLYASLALDGTVLMHTFGGSGFATNGMWLSRSEVVQKVRRLGDLGAGLSVPATYSSDGPNSSPHNGRIAFSSTLNPNQPLGQGVWLFESATGMNSLILRPGMSLTNAPGTIDGSPLESDNLVIRPAFLDDVGNTYMAVYVSSALTIVRVHDGTANKVLAAGDDAPFVGTGNVITNVSIINVTPNGDLLLLVDHSPSGARRSLVLEHLDTFTIKYTEGQTIAGLPSDASARPLNPQMNLSGDAVFRTTLVGTGINNTNNDALVVSTAAGARVAARESTPVPGIPGATWRSTFPSYFMGADGSAVFQGDYSVPAGASRGLFLNTSDGTIPIVAEGVVSGLDSGETATSLLDTYVPTPGGGLGFLFWATLLNETGTSQSALLYYLPGSPTRVLHRANDLMDIDGVLTPVSVRAVLGFNADGTVLAQIVYSTFDRGIVTFNLVSPGTCPIDLANQQGDPVPDGAVDINDLLLFLAAFQEGNEGANIDDDGQDPLTPDAGVDINDLISFLRRFEAGC